MTNELQPREGETFRESPVTAWLRVLRNAWLLILFCGVLAATTGYAFSSRQPDSFKATSALLFEDPSSNFGQQLFGAAFAAPYGDPERRGATNLRLVSLSIVATRTARALGTGYTTRSIQGMVEVAPAGNSNVIAVTATNRDPVRAARIANTFAEQYVAMRRTSDRSKLRRASEVVKQRIASSTAAPNSTERRELSALDDRLQVLATLQTGNAELVQPATVPRVRSAPRPRRSAVFGALLGILLGIALAIGQRQLDQRLRTLDEVEALTGWPVLATVPFERTLEGKTKLPFNTHGAFLESFRLLRARLRYFNVDKKIQTLLVSSAQPGEGKTTILINLARVCAQAGDRVILVEADLRRPSISSRLGIPPSLGLAELLGQHLDVADVTHVIEDPVLGCTFSVLPAGVTPPNAAELLESARMVDLLDDLRASFDIILIDSPPTTVVSDTIPLMGRVDGVVIVTRFGRASRSVTRALAQDLHRFEAPVLGVIANLVGSDQGYHYGYYGYDADVPLARDTAPA